MHPAHTRGALATTTHPVQIRCSKLSSQITTFLPERRLGHSRHRATGSSFRPPSKVLPSCKSEAKCSPVCPPFCCQQPADRTKAPLPAPSPSPSPSTLALDTVGAAVQEYHESSLKWPPVASTHYLDYPTTVIDPLSVAFLSASWPRALLYLITEHGPFTGSCKRDAGIRLQSALLRGLDRATHPPLDQGAHPIIHPRSCPPSTPLAGELQPAPRCVWENPSWCSRSGRATARFAPGCVTSPIDIVEGGEHTNDSRRSSALVASSHQTHSTCHY